MELLTSDNYDNEAISLSYLATHEMGSSARVNLRVSLYAFSQAPELSALDVVSSNALFA